MPIDICLEMLRCHPALLEIVQRVPAVISTKIFSERFSEISTQQSPPLLVQLRKLILNQMRLLASRPLQSSLFVMLLPRPRRSLLFFILSGLLAAVVRGAPPHPKTILPHAPLPRVPVASSTLASGSTPVPPATPRPTSGRHLPLSSLPTPQVSAPHGIHPDPLHPFISGSAALPCTFTTVDGNKSSDSHGGATECALLTQRHEVAALHQQVAALTATVAALSATVATLTRDRAPLQSGQSHASGDDNRRILGGVDAVRALVTFGGDEIPAASLSSCTDVSLGVGQLKLPPPSHGLAPSSRARASDGRYTGANPNDSETADERAAWRAFAAAAAADGAGDVSREPTSAPARNRCSVHHSSCQAASGVSRVA